MTAASESAKMPAGDAMIRYWFMWLGLPAMIIVLTWWVSVSLIVNRALGTIRYSISSHKSEICDIASWLMVMLLSGCIIIMQVAPVNSPARIGANYFSKTLIMLLATVFSAMLTEFLPLPVVCVAWFIVAINFVCACRMG